MPVVKSEKMIVPAQNCEGNTRFVFKYIFCESNYKRKTEKEIVQSKKN